MRPSRAHLAWLPLAGMLIAAAPRRQEPPPVREGLASFYGRELQGRTTASGEKFDPNHLTAAYPAYPGGTILKVTNLENSRSVQVRVTDRGPAKRIRRKGVIIDLSRAAARELGFSHDGKARVRIELVRRGRERGGSEG